MHVLAADLTAAFIPAAGAPTFSIAIVYEFCDISVKDTMKLWICVTMAPLFTLMSCLTYVTVFNLNYTISALYLDDCLALNHY